MIEDEMSAYSDSCGRLSPTSCLSVTSSFSSFHITPFCPLCHFYLFYQVEGCCNVVQNSTADYYFGSTLRHLLDYATCCVQTAETHRINFTFSYVS
jgi:hypothetical protein